MNSALKENQGADIWYIELKLCGESMLHNHFQRLVISRLTMSQVASICCRQTIQKSGTNAVFITEKRKKEKLLMLPNGNMEFLTLLILHFKVGF